MEAPRDGNLDDLLAEREAVAGLARRLSGRDVHAAEDLEQEVWAAALAHPPREKSSLRGWLRVVTRSRSVERLRRRGRAGRAEREAARPEAIEGADESVARFDQAARLAQALRELEEPYRSVLILRFVEDLAPREAARRLDRPVETVRTQTRRGLILLRRKLESREGRHPSWSLFLFLLRRPRPRASAVFAAVAGVAALIVLALALGRPRRAASDAAAPAALASAPAAAPASARDGDVARVAAAPLAPQPRAATTLAARWVDVALSDELGAALAGAEVRVVGHAGARAAGRTDARGHLRVPLEFSDLASAHPEWLLERDAVELAFEADGRASLNAFVFLPESGGTPLAVALAQPSRALAGRLIDARGLPLAGAQVQVGPAHRLGERERLDEEGRALLVVRWRAATSDEQGRFALQGLPREPLALAARADGQALAALEVGPEEREVELRLEPAEPLRGVVRLGGRPAAGARVEWSAGDGPAWPAEWCRAIADREGRFELPRPAQGTLTLAAQSDGARAATALELSPAPTWTAELVLGRELAVRLLESDGRPAAGLYLCLRAASGGPVLAAAESDDDGHARFATDAAGPCDLVVLPPKGEGTWPREVVRDLPGPGGPELVLRLAPPDARTAALAAQFAPGSSARLVLRHVAGEVEHTAAPDEEGRVAWGALPAGRWSARALLGEGRERSLGEFELGPGETLDLGRIE